MDAMDRIENDEPPMPMEMETTDNSLPNAQENADADKVLCHKCGASIIAKNAHYARLTLWGHPVECRLFGKCCKAFSADDCGKETDCAINNILVPTTFLS